MSMRLLEGEVTEDPQEELAALHDELRAVRAELAIAKRETQQAREEARRALGALRRQLTPLYRALQAVFGELDAAGPVEEEPTMHSALPPRVAAVWASWKAKVGAGPANVIDALLLHGDLNTQQLALAIGVDRTTVPNYIHRLHAAGLINKNAGRFSLKVLS